VLSESSLAGEGPALYRKRAEEMLQRAESASTAQSRAEFLALADHWLRLARTLEQPNW
jgi:hypothetical protein